MLQELLNMSLIDMFIIAFKIMLVTSVCGFIFFIFVSIIGVALIKITKFFSSDDSH